jgi:hypothetical protein
VASLELRPRLPTEIVDAGFQLYRRHFGALVALSAAVFAPYIVLQILLTGGQPEATVSGGITVAVLMGVGWVFGSLAEAAIVIAVSNSYLHGDPDTTDALRRTFSRLGAVMLAVLLKWFIIALGFMLGVFLGLTIGAVIGAATGLIAAGPTGAIVIGLVVAVTSLIGGLLGLYYFGAYFAVPATVVLEHLGPRAGLRRSKALSEGYKRQVYGALGIPMFLFLVLQAVFIGLLEVMSVPLLLSFLVQQAITVVVSPVISVIATLLYYDARIRKEGFDIEVMAAELGPVAPATPVPPPTPAA